MIRRVVPVADLSYDSGDRLRRFGDGAWSRSGVVRHAGAAPQPPDDGTGKAGPMATGGSIPVDALPEVRISRRSAGRIGSGVLWVYSNEVEGRDTQQTAAYLCRFTHQGRPAAAGYFNRHSLIAGRVLAFGGEPDLEAAVVRRLRAALQRRSPLSPDAAVRLAFSEADLLPGLVVDFYPPCAVIQSNTAGMDLLLPRIEALVAEMIEEATGSRLDALVVRCDAGIRRLEAVELCKRVCFGDKARLSGVAVEEDGVQYVADLLEGQKTGFFLDQRENRRFLDRRLKQMVSPRVLDLFCYSGGWGLRALSAGAEHATFVDESREALQLLERGLAANGLPAARAQIVRADVFEFLSRDKGLYDVVVADPPAFVKSRKNLPQAVSAYRKLNRLAWRRVRPGGLLLTCSCSQHLSEGGFLDLLASAVSREKSLAQVVYRGRQAADHPGLLSMPETAYLKCIGLQKVGTL
jgi:23S rRNA (cytosine1962-C5)-methyltransferase